MKISGIDFPATLLSALRDSNLVVFAGAGVSMGEPASLPDFRQLARKLAHGTGETLDDTEPVDRFLGKLQRRAIDVHARAAEVLRLNSLGDLPQPTTLHTDLIRLYDQSPPLRLVTTNFDSLFEVAAQNHLTAAPTLFTAPALPIGQDFQGIVHLHGTTAHSPSMVLTDADFGRAYLTQGWARRFLLQLFRSSPVLFVGYSHQDTVMHYLSRALPARDSCPRFALVKEEQSEIKHFDHLGIRPLPYPKSPADGHAGLYHGLRALAEHATLGLLGWQKRIVGLARQSPPMDEEDADLLHDALQDSTKTRFFTRAAEDPRWIEWLDTRGHLKPLFSNAELPGPQLNLARWLPDAFARKSSDELFLLISRHHTRVHPRFWFELAAAIGSEDPPPLPDDVLSYWASLLLTTASTSFHAVPLCRLAERCAKQDLFDRVMEIFDALIGHRLTLNQRTPSSFSPDADGLSRVDMHLDLAHSSEHSVRALWRDTLVPRLEHVARHLLPRITARLVNRHQAHCAWDKANRNYDTEAFRRHAIESHQQDEFSQPADILIDAARDCLEHLAEFRPEVAARWSDEYAKSDPPLLRRLTVHTLDVREDLNSNEKCDWLLHHIDIHDIAVHHENFRVARRIYPALGEPRRRALLRAIHAYRYPGDQDRERLTAGHHYDWFEWLQRADPECPLIAQALEDIRNRFPEFEPREHPDLTHYMSHVVRVDDQSPWTVEQLLACPADQWTERLLAFQPTEHFGPRRSALLLSIEEAATRQFDWGLALSDALLGGDHWTSDIWATLLRSWSKSELNEEQRRRVLRRLRASQIRDAQVIPIADFLYEAHKPSPSLDLHESLQLANELASALWDRLVGTEPQANEFHDWLTRAINHPAGNLSQFWICSLWISRSRQDPVPKTIDEAYRVELSKILQDESVFGTLAHSVLCRSFSLLLEADESWTKDHLLPLFNINAGLPNSTAAWDGFLYGNTTIPAIETMKPALLEAAPRLQSDFQEQSFAERFIDTYAYVLFFHIDDPLQLWLPQLFQHLDLNGRRTFAWKIRHHLRQLNDTQCLAGWDRWLRRYWDRRLHGVPQTLHAEEIDAMLAWLPHLKIVFQQAVDTAIQMPHEHLPHGFVLHEILKAKLHAHYPESVAKLMVYLRHCGLHAISWNEATSAINQLLASDIPQDLKTSLQEIIAEFGLE